jgi:Ca2+-binding RTX toxin-like protein
VPDLAVQVVPASATIEPNGVDDVSVFVTNHGGAGSLQTTLTIALPGTMSLLGSPGFERGSGCTGATTLTCYLDYVPNASQTKVWFSVRVGAALGEQTITASVTADRDANTADNTAAAVVTVRQAQPGGDTGGNTEPRGSNLSVRTGTARADVLRGTAGRDRLDGRGGNDVLWGLGGVDILLGGAGNDRLIGGAGKDQLLGGAGNDRLEARDHARDVVNCGPGKDTAVVDRVDVVRGCELVKRAA